MAGAMLPPEFKRDDDGSANLDASGIKSAQRAFVVGWRLVDHVSHLDPAVALQIQLGQLADVEHLAHRVLEPLQIVRLLDPPRPLLRKRPEFFLEQYP
jgi:hypothetical protein